MPTIEDNRLWFRKRCQIIFLRERVKPRRHLRKTTQDNK